jgi:transaldolase
VINGVTTNPSLMVKEKNKNFEEIIKEITDIVNGPISVEVVSTETEEMIKDAIKLSELSENIVIKIPMIPNGLKAVRILNTKDIKTNVTLAFSVNQTLLAAKAGATYVSIFVGRLDDIGHEGIQIIRDAVNIFNIYDIETEIIAASIRHPLHVIESAKTGVHITTIPFNIIEKMFSHPLTDMGIERFLKDWEMVKK